MLSHQTNFENFALQYHNQIGWEGDLNHKNNVDPSLIELMGNIENFTVYDIGCGNGYLDFQLIKYGASKVIASDVSETLINFALQKVKAESIKNVDFVVSEGSDFSFIIENELQLDLVISNLAFHYIYDVKTLVQNLSSTVKNGGKVVFSIAHPLDDFELYKSRVSPETIQSIGQKYLQPYEHQIRWRGENELTIYKRPISYYISLFANSHFLLYGLKEIPRMYYKSGELIKTPFPGFITFAFIKK